MNHVSVDEIMLLLTKRTGMKGLLKNNFYATLSNAKVFAAIMLLLGIFVVAMDNKIPSLIIGYMLLAMIGFSLNSIASLRKESATNGANTNLPHL